MHYVFYDTETTGLTKDDEVIQFAAIITDDNLKMESFVNFYCYTQKEISPGARNTHGIDAGKLWKLSGGKSFEDQFFNTSLPHRKDVTWVSYSKGGFDERLVNQTLYKNGLPKYDFGKRYKYFGATTEGISTVDFFGLLQNRCFNGNSRKLSQAVLDVGINEDFIISEYKRIFNVTDNAVFHDALFDAFSIYLIALFKKNILGL